MQAPVPTEFADQGSPNGIGCPFSIDDAVVLVHVQPVNIRPLKLFSDTLETLSYTPCLAELVQSTLGLPDRLNPFLGLGIPPSERIRERGEPGIELDHACSKVSCVFKAETIEHETHPCRLWECRSWPPAHHWPASWMSFRTQNPLFRGDAGLKMTRFGDRASVESPQQKSRAFLGRNAVLLGKAQTTIGGKREGEKITEHTKPKGKPVP